MGEEIAAAIDVSALLCSTLHFWNDRQRLRSTAYDRLPHPVHRSDILHFGVLKSLNERLIRNVRHDVVVRSKWFLDVPSFGLDVAGLSTGGKYDAPVLEAFVDVAVA